MRIHAINTLLRAAILGLLLTVWCSMIIAAEQSQAEQSQAGPWAVERAKTIAPFIDEQTVAVARIDFTMIKIGPLVDKVGKYVPEAKPHLAAAKAIGTAWLGAVNLAGGTEIYYIFTLAGPLSDKNMMFAVVPLNEKSNVDTLTALLKQSNPRGFTTVERMSNCLVGGSSTTIERLKTLKPVHRPEIKMAFKTAGGMAAQLLIVPPHYFRRVIEEMMPMLPEEVGGGSSKFLTDGFLWAAISVDAPPKTTLRGTIQSKEKKSAGALLGFWRQVYPLLLEEVESQRGYFGPSLNDMNKLFEVLMPKLDGDRLLLILDENNDGIAKLVDVLRPAIEDTRRSARKADMLSNFKQIAVSMHAHHTAKSTFPASASYDADGRPLLSWRVHLLPYLEQESLYKQFHLDEPWDSPHNKKLIAKIPHLYRTPESAAANQGMTRYLVPVGENTVFSGKKGLAIKDIRGGTSNTIMVVEAATDAAVPWTKPADFQYNPQNPSKGLGDASTDNFIAVFCDGSVKPIPKKTDPEKLRKLFDRNR